jgi:hypothetical protein
VPQFEELASKIIYPKVKRLYPNFFEYFPECPETKDYVSPKMFSWDVLSTFNNDLANRFIENVMEQRVGEERGGDKTMEISDDVFEHRQ